MRLFWVPFRQKRIFNPRERFIIHIQRDRHSQIISPHIQNIIRGKKREKNTVNFVKSYFDWKSWTRTHCPESNQTTYRISTLCVVLIIQLLKLQTQRTCSISSLFSHSSVYLWINEYPFWCVSLSHSLQWPWRCFSFTKRLAWVRKFEQIICSSLLNNSWMALNLY